MKGVLEAFLRMPDDLQEEYLQLANKYDENPSQWSEYSRQLFVIKEEQVQGLGLTALSEETANRVWQIQETNSFQNGVFLKIARFNHSCCPNAEFSWIQKIGRREVRAVRRITKGEEILFCYSRLGDEFRSRARRAYLQELYHFTCDCIACNQSEEEEELEEKEWERRREIEREEEMKEAELFLETFHLDLME